MTGLDLVLLSTLINFIITQLSAPDPEPICLVKTYIAHEEKNTEIQKPVFCKDIGL